jgi:hypothetical protein
LTKMHHSQMKWYGPKPKPGPFTEKANSLSTINCQPFSNSLWYYVGLQSCLPAVWSAPLSQPSGTWDKFPETVPKLQPSDTIDSNCKVNLQGVAKKPKKTLTKTKIDK